MQIIRYRIGLFSEYQVIDWGRVNRLVFVCKGNICRSAYAEGRAKMLGVPATSFGLAATAGERADPSAVEAAKSRGVDLTSHLTRSPQGVALGTGDLLLAMEAYQAKGVRDCGTRAGAQLTLLGLWCAPKSPHLEDPFGLSKEYFATCFGLIDNAIDRISDHMTRTDVTKCTL